MKDFSEAWPVPGYWQISQAQRSNKWEAIMAIKHELKAGMFTVADLKIRIQELRDDAWVCLEQTPGGPMRAITIEMGASEPFILLGTGEPPPASPQWKALADDGARYQWLKKINPSALFGIAWSNLAACKYHGGDPDAAIDAAMAAPDQQRTI